MSDREDDFVRRAAASLDDSVEALDGTTRSQLAAARNSALEGRRRRSSFAGFPYATPVAASLLGVVVGLGVLLWPGDDPGEALDTLALAEDDAGLIELLALQDPAELAEDPDFYVWVEDQLATEEGTDAG